MRALPSGTVTFLFSDVEGSTRLLQEHGERYAETLAEHRRKLREAVAPHGGVEVDTQGDAFFFAFAGAPDAVAAADDAQAALAESPVRVRIGIHTGEPQLTDEGYVGIDVHKAARICSTAHGGQVVLSGRTRSLLDGSFSVTDLGLHRLKDLGDPEKLFQLGDEAFPPLRSLNATNLPAQPSPLIGREAELEEVQALVREERLVTLTGPGGCGKTRLGLQVAAELIGEFKDGVFWVPLAGLTDPELVLPTIAATLGAHDGLIEHIDERRMLLLLDNLEQIIDCAPALGRLLESCPNLQLLVTSRAVLRIAGERAYEVASLGEHDAIMLFRARAFQAEPLEAVKEICGRLDGMPLAIELAAARTRVLAPKLLLERLEHRLPLLTSGVRDAPARQRTLLATIEWSYDLLSAEERRLFARLAVFAGSFDLASGERVCNADLDTLESVLEQSLLRRTDEGRFFYLETIREFALGRLDGSGDADEIRQRHAEWFCARAEHLRATLWDAENEAAVASFDLDHANVLAALEWSDRSDPSLLMRLATGVWEYWLIRAYFRDGRRWLERAVTANPARRTPARADALIGISALAHVQGDNECARVTAAEALLLTRELGDARAISTALNRLANALSAEGDRAAARRLYEEAVGLVRPEGASRWLAVSLLNLGVAQAKDGMRDLAKATVRDALSVFDAVGNVPGRAAALLHLAWIAIHEGATDDAVLLLADSARIYRGLDRPARIAECLDAFAVIAEQQDNTARAVRLRAACDKLQKEAGIRGTLRDAPDRDPLLATARAALPDSAFADAWTSGARMTLDEAMEYALEGDFSVPR